jgi:hypothetical protein
MAHSNWNPNWKLPRFHIDIGPSSLFERIHYIFAQPRTLSLNTKHFQEKAVPADIVDLIKSFDSKDWKLVSAEVFKGSGKFAKTAWRRTVGQDVWHVVIGYGNVVVTCYQVQEGSGSGRSKSLTPSDPFYAKVEAVNAQLMAEATSQKTDSNGPGI